MLNGGPKVGFLYETKVLCQVWRSFFCWIINLFFSTFDYIHECLYECWFRTKKTKVFLKKKTMYFSLSSVATWRPRLPKHIRRDGTSCSKAIRPRIKLCLDPIVPQRVKLPPTPIFGPLVLQYLAMPMILHQMFLRQRSPAFWTPVSPPMHPPKNKRTWTIMWSPATNALPKLKIVLRNAYPRTVLTLTAATDRIHSHPVIIGASLDRPIVSFSNICDFFSADRHNIVWIERFWAQRQFLLKFGTLKTLFDSILKMNKLFLGSNQFII